MYLAGILGLCALLHLPASGSVGSGVSPFAVADARGVRQLTYHQEPAKPEPPPAQTPQQDQAKPDSAPAQAPPSGPESPQETSKPEPSAAPQEQNPSPAKPQTPKKRPVKKKHVPAPAGDQPPKKVIRHGSTVEPTTQLAPGITGEQATRQREVTNRLLASTDASLQKLSGRALTKDQQDTVAQVRKFMEQVKAADAAGDLQRAYKLAMKAHLLSDALAKP